MKITSQYGFRVSSKTGETPTIDLVPSDPRAIPGDVVLMLKPGVTPTLADDLRQSLSDKVGEISCENKNNNSSLFAAWVIGPYLVLHTLLLVGLSSLVWLASCWEQLFHFAGFSYASTGLALSAEKFSLFQRLVLSACAAGLGGGVFMIREFYLKFCYGQYNEFLKRTEIPRYVLLPFSSIVLGPISLALAKAGTITFGGLSANTNAPILTVVAVSFILGFAYHDTLKWLAKISEKILTSKKDVDSK